LCCYKYILVYWYTRVIYIYTSIYNLEGRAQGAGQGVLCGILGIFGIGIPGIPGIRGTSRSRKRNRKRNRSRKRMNREGKSGMVKSNRQTKTNHKLQQFSIFS
jgi:hypothetical protein